MAIATVLRITSTLGVLVLLAIGVFGLLRPTAFAAQVGVRADTPAGMGELRAVFGGFMLAMVAALTLIGSPVVYLTVGVLWLGAGVAKTISFFLDRPAIKDGVQGIVSDAVIAALVLSGYFQS
ncbi:MAG: hypothetical protein H6Q33_1994 [Deltaproteobacteria bacterium]|jgi:hypothetical protein|nr:hypothetical protein [Deltaproteobacteria bacterium]